MEQHGLRAEKKENLKGGWVDNMGSERGKGNHTDRWEIRKKHGIEKYYKKRHKRG